jgi:hypothetical protein
MGLLMASGTYQPTFPSSQTTGWEHTGVSLATYTGDRYLTWAESPNNDGVFQGFLFPDPVVIDDDNIVIRRSKITGTNPYGIRQVPGVSGLELTDVEVTSGDPGDINNQIDRACAFEGGNVVVDRLYVHHCWRGLGMYAEGISVKRSYVGDNINPDGGEHSTVIHAAGGANGIVLEANNFGINPDTEASATFSMYPENASNNDWVIRGNLIRNSGGYVIKVGYTPPESPNTDFTFVDNWISTEFYENGGIYGVQDSWSEVTGETWRGNRWWDARASGGGYVNKHGEIVQDTE